MRGLLHLDRSGGAKCRTKMRKVPVVIAFAPPFEVEHSEWSTGACSTAPLLRLFIGGQVERSSRAEQQSGASPAHIRSPTWQAGAAAASRPCPARPTARCEPPLIRTVTQKLGARAALHIIDEADHSFHVPRRSGRTDEDVIDEAAAIVADWLNKRGDG
jgi:hypothetical protein